MTIKECYEVIGGDYEAVCQRMMRKEALVMKFTKKFLDDDSFKSLKDNLSAGNLEEAFRAAHTLKGVSQNLAFEALYKPSSDLAEILRAGSTEGAEELMEIITKEYEKTVAAISQL
ncbi:MAG: Hpt domain-containing protein [Dorea sp.]|jgi:HPt (histidine-containing phosphotransfer) domain-containing protein|nr:Hpt domain-containing protein [Dorea sp.]